METIRLTRENVEEAAARAGVVLGAGGVVLYPTDTLYGFGADAFSNDAVDKIYGIKGRDEKKPIHALVSDLEMAARFGEITDAVRSLAEKLPQGKATFIVRKKPGIETGIARTIETFGFRIPDNAFCIAMIKAFGDPVTATSANKAGEPPLRSIPEILSQLGANAGMIDLVIDAGELPESKPSTVIDLSSGEVRILREGAIAKDDIENI